MSEASRAFHDSVTQDPLFAAEGMDLENAQRALDELEAALRDLNREYGTSLPRRLFLVRYPLERYAVPVSFLRSFVACERARRAYLDAPSRQTALELLGAWHEAAKRMREHLARYRSLHQMLVRLESDERTFVMQDMYGHLTSYGHARGTIDQLLSNADALLREVKARRALLSGEASFNAEPPALAPLPTMHPAPMSALQGRLLTEAIEGGTWPFRYGEIVERHGPFSFALPNFDREPAERACMLYVLEDTATSLKSMWIMLVDKFYVLDIWNLKHADDEIVRGKYATWVGLQKEEMPFWYEPATNLYNSRDCSYWMHIGTVVDLKRRPELDRELVERQRSSLFDLLLAECARDTRIMTSHLRRRARSGTDTKYSMLYDLLTRTYPSAYYLPFNGSVWRLSDLPQFLGDGFKSPDPNNRLSDDAIESLAPEVLRTVMSASRLREERGRAAGWLT